MSAHDFGRRIVSTHRCRCGEFPKMSFDAGNGYVWLSCAVCGQVSGADPDAGRAIYAWNLKNTEGQHGVD